ncbi:MAG: hypothetical protein AB7Y46_00735 [Armatimonadota bacterium]
MSKQIITIIVVVVALAVIGVINYMNQMDPTQLAARGVGRGDHHHHGDDSNAQQDGPPPLSRLDEDYLVPIGDENAPVKIVVCYSNISIVKDQFRKIVEDVAVAWSPHVRVEFMDTTDPENRKVLDKVSTRLRDGLLINGEVVKQVPQTAFRVVAFSGLPEFEEWTVDELMMAIEYELKKKGIEAKPRPLPGPAQAQGGEHAHSH